MAWQIGDDVMKTNSNEPVPELEGVGGAQCWIWYGMVTKEESGQRVHCIQAVRGNLYHNVTWDDQTPRPLAIAALREAIKSWGG